MSSNLHPVSLNIHNALVDKFPRGTQHRLGNYTTEEVFYLLILLCVPKPPKEMTYRHVTMLSLQNRLKRYLAGDDGCYLYPSYLSELARAFRWRGQWSMFHTALENDISTEKVCADAPTALLAQWKVAS